MNESSDFLSREFRMAARYRRIGWYVLFGLILLIGVAAWVRLFVIGLPFQAGQKAAFIAWSAMFLGAAMALLCFLFRWRLRIDERGISRRRFLSWDLWKWDEFEAGMIRRKGKTFVSIPRPRWKDTLTFEFLEEADQNCLLRICRAFYNAPADECHVGELPEELTLRWRICVLVHLREEGLHIEDGRGFLGWGVIREPWENMKAVRLCRFDQWSSEILSVEFEFAQRKLTIDGFVVPVAPLAAFDRRLRGAFHPVVEHFLRVHVPEEKLKHFALHGPPRTIAERDRRIDTAKTRLVTIRWINRTVPAGLLALSAGCMGPKMIAMWAAPAVMPLGWLVVATICGTLAFGMNSFVIWAVLHSVCMAHAKTIRELEEWKPAESTVESQL